MLKITHIFYNQMTQTLSVRHSKQDPIQAHTDVASTLRGVSEPNEVVLESTQAPLHTIQKGDQQTRPFFLLHGNWTGGVPFYCYTLARTVGRHQPFHVLDPYHYQGSYKPASIEEMATEHLAAVRSVQPEGPYLLGGFCNGSLLAYEMTRQLHEQGQQVDLLLLIAPTGIPHVRQVIVQMISTICKWLRIKSNYPLTAFLRLRHAIRHLYRLTHAADDLKIRDFPQLVAIDGRLDVMFPPVHALYNDYVGVFTWIASRYEKHYIPENVEFIWAQEELDRRSEWRSMDKAENSVIVPGHHMQAVTDYSDLLAQAFKAILSQKQG
ncbi:thioesterase domain-containing protein [Dictyobacter arantiisoli]|uniref:Thioesterase domain-containing protein n=1 Tax=Dictyobacter arantiisoli TaxID=2014874 RepID=A0A5A5T962_9CHLR|nr:thioesterase domain-containing protein [Dictyobacter arantiisoli]GCF08030.1 hypothetical protein KDI_15940 [Dictyobacter arantiisoli]